MKSFIQVRLTFNMCGFLASLPLGNEVLLFYSCRCYSPVSSFSYSPRTINSGIDESSRVKEMSYFIC